ncbi:MAG: O-antigen ligase family protein [Actinomycetota bacterium]|nr:O-antigen ligase family protein [Actinomycetota bacterium]
MAALVFALAAASSNVYLLNIPVGRIARWVLLGILCALALLYAATSTRRRPRLVVPAVLAGALVLLAFASAFWSPDPRLTLGRAVTLALLVLTALALVYGTQGRPEAVGQILLAILVGALAVAVGGLIDLAVRPSLAYIPATTQSPLRYSGLGANPNTMAMLLALAVPIAVWTVAEAGTRWMKAAALGTLVLFDASIVAAASRGALLAAFLGVAMLIPALARTRRARMILAVAAVSVFALDVAVMAVPSPARTDPVLNKRFGSYVPLGPKDAQGVRPIESDIGFPESGDKPFRRSLYVSSGRLDAWVGASRQVAQRPLLGYGFGTEQRVFVDRFYLFYSSLVENSFLGTVLQLGVVGLGLLIALLVAIGRAGIRALGRTDEDGRRVAGACAGVVVCGLVVAATQSYLTSVGSPTAVPFWLCAALLVGLAPAAARRRTSP